MPTKQKPKKSVDLGENQVIEPSGIHCPICGRYRGQKAIVMGSISPKCPNCKDIYTINMRLDGAKKQSQIEPTEVRCSGCGEFMGYHSVIWGIVIFRCHRQGCKEKTKINITPVSEI